MKAIWKRDFKSYMENLIGPVMISAILLILFLFFFLNNLAGRNTDLAAPVYVTSAIAFTFAIPLLSMRSFAEETRNKTDQLYMTAPITIGQVVLGKFLAIATLLAIPTGIACLLPVLMRLFSRDVQLLNCYTSLLAFYLYALMLTSICLFFSALTDNILLSAVFSALFIVIGIFMGSAFSRIKITWLAKILSGALDFNSRMETMTYNGTLDFTTVIYFVSVTALFLFLCVQVIQKRRYTVSKKNLTVGAYSLSMIVVMIAVVVVANVFATQIPEHYRTVDVTGTRIRSISAESGKVVDQLKDPITIYYLSEKDQSNVYGSIDLDSRNIENILKDFAARSSRITLKYIDPITNPQFYAQYSDKALNYFSVIVVDQKTKRYKAIDVNDMLQTQMNEQTYSQEVTGYDVEGKVINAIQTVSAPEKDLQKVYLLSGQDEATLETNFQDRFAQFNMKTDSLDLTSVKEVPSDCALLMINAPASDLSKDDANKVITYLKKGGNLFLVLSFNSQKEMPNLASVLQLYGVKAEAGLAVEKDASHLYNSAQGSVNYYLYPEIGEDDMTASLKEGDGKIFVPASMALSYDKNTKDISYAELLTTSKDSFLSTDPKEAQDPQTGSIKEQRDDVKGPLVLGLKAVSKKSTAVIFTSDQLFTNAADQQVSGGKNLKLFGQVIRTFSNGKTDFVTVPVKQTTSYLTVTLKQAMVTGIFMMAIVILILVYGIVVFVSRRRK